MGEESQRVPFFSPRIRMVMVKKLLSTVCLSLGLMSAATAAPVFTENFDNAAFIGSAVLVFGSTSDSASSDRVGWANTSYYGINNFNGWTFGSDTYLAEKTDALGAKSGDGALLLNETTGVGTHIVGLS